MLKIIHCDQCDKKGRFDIHFQFEYKTDTCGKCHHTETNKWQYFFCDVACMFTWLKQNEIEEKGFPCQNCFSFETQEATGYLAGFESNGLCPTCQGSKRVKK